MLINHHNLGLFFTGLKTQFRRGFELASPMWNEVAMEIPSNTEREDYDWLGVSPEMREWLGDRVIHSLGTHGFSIANRDWELTIGAERNKLEDDKEGIYSPLAQRMGESAALHPDRLVFGAINDGRNAGALGYDGVPFFSASHPNEDVGTQSNLNSAGGGSYWYLADFSSVLKPIIFQNRKKLEFVSKQSLTDDEVFFRKRFLFGVDARYNVGYGLWQQMYASNQTLNETNLEAAWLAMTQLVADNGLPLNFRPTHLVVPQSLEFTAKRLISPSLVLDGSGAAGVENIHKNALKVIVSKFLS